MSMRGGDALGIRVLSSNRKHPFLVGRVASDSVYLCPCDRVGFDWHSAPVHTNLVNDEAFAGGEDQDDGTKQS